MPQTFLTQDAYDRLQAELHELETTERLAIQKRILAAREEGDLRENAEYHQAKEDQAFLEGRIAEMKHLLENSVIGEGPGGADTVDHGVKVTLRDDDGDEDVYLFTTTHERSVGLPVVTPESPLGKALHGRSVGDTITYQAPAGELSFEIVNIELP